MNPYTVQYQIGKGKKKGTIMRHFSYCLLDNQNIPCLAIVWAVLLRLGERRRWLFPDIGLCFKGNHPTA